MRANEFTNEASIKITGFGPSEKSKAWVAKVNDMFPQSPLNPNYRLMTFGQGNDMTIVQFELKPLAKSVEVKWIQATPLRSGAGSKAMKILQDLAREDGIKLTLYAWDKGQVSQSKLIKFYKKQGFNPIGKTGNMEWEPNIDEMALPADWDPSAFGHDKSFKSRLEYAKQRATKIGGGSSRVAFVIPDQGRETVLKVAKNNKGIAQNAAELDILTDGYLGKLDIVIPLVDYDKENSQPTWIQTEKAEKASEQKLTKMMRAGRYLFHLTTYANYLIGAADKWSTQRALDHLRSLSDTDAEIFKEYAQEIADLVSSSSLQMGDFDRAANWGIYNGRPVIIDLGYNDTVAKLYWG